MSLRFWSSRGAIERQAWCRQVSCREIEKEDEEEEQHGQDEAEPMQAEDEAEGSDLPMSCVIVSSHPPVSRASSHMPSTESERKLTA